MKKHKMINRKSQNIFMNILGGVIILTVSMLIISCGSSTKEKIMLNKEASENINTVYADSIASPAIAKDLDVNLKTPEGKKFIKTFDIKFQTNQVISATEKIEDLTCKFDGFIIYSYLQNREENQKRTHLRRDSILNSRQITVFNNMQLKIPNDKLDSFIRSLNPLVLFLDYRIYKLDEVTLQYLSNNKKEDRLKSFEQRQIKLIESKESRLKDATYAEDKLLDRQNEADNIKLNTLKLDDDIKYCTINIEIYQKPIIVNNVIPDFNYVSNLKPNIFKRMGDSTVKGWRLLEETIVFLINLWGIALLIILLMFLVKYIRKIYKRL